MNATYLETNSTDRMMSRVCAAFLVCFTLLSASTVAHAQARLAKRGQVFCETRGAAEIYARGGGHNAYTRQIVREDCRNDLSGLSYTVEDVEAKYGVLQVRVNGVRMFIKAE